MWETDGCRAACDDADSLDCLFTCSAQDQACGQCLILDMIGGSGCARSQCGESLGAVAGCFRSCVGRLVAGEGWQSVYKIPALTNTPISMSV